MAARSARHGRTVVLGLDSLDLHLVERWAAQGQLPFFSRLLRESPLVHLPAAGRVMQGSLWPSLLTGRTPGDHGIYYSPALTSGSYHLDPVKADRMTCETFHERLGANGVRYAMIDVPTDRPHNQANGIQVVDWGTEFQYWHYTTHPPELREQIESRIGKHFMSEGTHVSGETVAKHRELLDLLEQGVRMKSALTAELLARQDLDLIFTVFCEPHKAGHFLWKYMDVTHPDHVAGEPRLRDAILSVYRLIDAELARLAGSLRAQDNLIVLSDMGMQANYRGEHFMGAVLARLGLCESPREARIDQDASQLSPTGRMTGTLRGALGRAVRRIAPPALLSGLRRRFGAAAGIDWSRTRAFALPTDRISYVRINLRGREPEGIVEPGAEYDALLRQIEQEFRALINVETGQPAVEEVSSIHKLYPGPHAHDLPDISVLWRSEAPINILESPTVGRLEIRAREDRSGSHRPDGFLLARGPAFRSGRVELRGDILQIAPTLLAMHDVAIPHSYAMGPLTALFGARRMAVA